MHAERGKGGKEIERMLMVAVVKLHCLTNPFKTLKFPLPKTNIYMYVCVCVCINSIEI